MLIIHLQLIEATWRWFWRSPWETRGSGVLQLPTSAMWSTRHIMASVPLTLTPSRWDRQDLNQTKRPDSFFRLLVCENDDTVLSQLWVRCLDPGTPQAKLFCHTVLLICVFSCLLTPLSPLWREVVTSPSKYVCHRATGPSWLINTLVHDDGWYSDAAVENAQTAPRWLEQRLRSWDENEMRMSIMWIGIRHGIELAERMLQTVEAFLMWWLKWNMDPNGGSVINCIRWVSRMLKSGSRCPASKTKIKLLLSQVCWPGNRRKL